MNLGEPEDCVGACAPACAVAGAVTGEAVFCHRHDDEGNRGCCDVMGIQGCMDPKLFDRIGV